MTETERLNLINEIKRLSMKLELEDDRIKRNISTYGNDMRDVYDAVVITKGKYSAAMENNWNMDPVLLRIMDNIQLKLQGQKSIPQSTYECYFNVLKQSENIWQLIKKYNYEKIDLDLNESIVMLIVECINMLMFEINKK